jgi:tRNA uridine 5-carboxymethylaminomethyl modification enzyme
MKTDIIVIGGGHAGIEAAYIASKKNLQVLLITGNIDLIGQMSCNPSIGGVAKGNLVREIDALGGLMGKIIDTTGIHFKMLNQSKGIAVWGNRAQADKAQYRFFAQRCLFGRSNLSFLQGFVTTILTEGDKVSGVMLDSGEKIFSSAVILCAGTFLNGMVHIGLNSFSAGRIGEPPSKGITESINQLGIKSGRLKTGTSPRLDSRSIDFSKFEQQYGDEDPWPFSFSTNRINAKSVCCYIGKTSKRTHEIILNNLHQSPLYTGKIKSIGPRYCPSIEDKIVRFGEREGHTLFLEPEGIETNEVYINGLSTSLPFNIQIELVKSINGLENTKIIRPGYGIEYDFFQPLQLKSTLESKIVKNLYFAGQINGTSGYEEAASQGIIAGINAAQKILNEEELVLGRETSYIGVLIDDLITRGTEEPYRMFTSRAEYRLLLRQDNSDERLMPLSFKLGFLEKEIFNQRQAFWEKKEDVKAKLKTINIKIENKNKNAYELLKRPEITIEYIEKASDTILTDDKKMQISIEADIKYKGFEEKERKNIVFLNKIDGIRIPENINYSKLNGILTGSINKLITLKPGTLGQASRIPGITPSDIYTLAIYISRFNQDVSRETVG